MKNIGGRNNKDFDELEEFDNYPDAADLEEEDSARRKIIKGIRASNKKPSQKKKNKPWEKE